MWRSGWGSPAPLLGFSPGKHSSSTAFFFFAGLCSVCTGLQKRPRKDLPVLNSRPGIKMSSASLSLLIAVIQIEAIPAHLQSGISEPSLQSIN